MAVAGAGCLGGWCWPVNDVFLGCWYRLASRYYRRALWQRQCLPDRDYRYFGDTGFAGQSWQCDSGAGACSFAGWKSVGLGGGGADLAIAWYWLLE